MKRDGARGSVSVVDRGRSQLVQARQERTPYGGPLLWGVLHLDVSEERLPERPALVVRTRKSGQD